MSASNTPSTDWREVISPDENARFAAYAATLTTLQRQRSERLGAGRALHRKQLIAIKGKLTVLERLPEFAQQGLFATPGTHEVWLRYSNGGSDKQPDGKPDVRGLAFKVFGVSGESALGGPARSQDFSLINHAQFAFPKSDEFIGFVEGLSRGPWSLISYLVRRYGLFKGLSHLIRMVKNTSTPFFGFETETLYSAVPIACGPYAVRYRLLPAQGNGPAPAQPPADLGQALAARLKQAPLQYELQLQPFVSEEVTPIEDASVNWPTPYVTVARLELPVQALDGQALQAFQTEAEAEVFDPWQALAAHRPLGDVQRARKVAYYESQKARAHS